MPQRRKLKLQPKKVLSGPRVDKYLKDEGIGKLEDLFHRLAYGRLSYKQVLDAILEPDQVRETPPPAEGQSVLQRAVDRLSGTGPLLIKGHGDLMASLAKCCRPVPGDELIGYVTRGRGISVHSRECPNLKSLSFDESRLIDVDWARQTKTDATYPVALVLETEDQKGMLARLTEVIAKEGSNIRNFQAGTDTGRGIITFVVEVRNRKHLDRMCHAFESVGGVIRVRRSMAEPRSRGA